MWGVPTEASRLGARQAVQINRQLPIVRSPVIDRYLERLGRTIVAQTALRGEEFRFYLVNSERVNAFALPGGFIYVTRGLIARTDQVSELAGVLAHEIAHVVEGHSAEQIERMQTAGIGTALACLLTSICESGAARTVIQVGGSVVMAQYSQEAEREADRAAVRYLVQAGIDPHGMIGMFRELLEAEQRQPGLLAPFFSTHPLTESRIEYVQEEIDELPDRRLEGLASAAPWFDRFREAVADLPPT